MSSYWNSGVRAGRSINRLLSHCKILAVNVTVIMMKAFNFKLRTFESTAGGTRNNTCEVFTGGAKLKLIVPQ